MSSTLRVPAENEDVPHQPSLGISVVIPVVMVAVAVGYLNYDAGRFTIGRDGGGALIEMTAIGGAGRSRRPMTRRTSSSNLLRYASPDAGITAVAFLDTWANGWSTMSRIEFRAKDGELLAARDWPSESTAAQVRQLAWTPDSRFFVYSFRPVEGGYFNLFYYDRKENSIKAIAGSLINPGSGPDFALIAPDSVTFAVESGGQPEQNTVSLPSLKK